ncbi:unnamed protein product [Nippostrongylus brasiliensis]|uniref:REJ domain-containing protein n=1 Tax=Nippostrongylus brasiliensis TaxID=27835 RepID=A0A0N4YQJ0_NIPBR|nr:unnamed protein product [Nippostrongylus brasiliensis]
MVPKARGLHWTLKFFLSKCSGSVDDDKIVSYKWTQDKGPSIPLPAMNTPILTLDNMVAGSYVFSVQVTDSGGLSSTASVNVEIRAERDDPPKAHINECGSMENSGSITVRLPLAEINLCGNSSTDDKVYSICSVFSDVINFGFSGLLL